MNYKLKKDDKYDYIDGFVAESLRSLVKLKPIVSYMPHNDVIFYKLTILNSKLLQEMYL